MLGLFAGIASLFAGFGSTVNKNQNDRYYRNQAKENNKSTYFDSRGVQRNTATGNNVVYRYDHSNYTCSKVDYKTGQVLSTRPSGPTGIKYERYLEGCKKYDEFNRKNKEEAIRQGKPFYEAMVYKQDLRKYDGMDRHRCYVEINDPSKEYETGHLIYDEMNDAYIGSKYGGPIHYWMQIGPKQAYVYVIYEEYADIKKKIGYTLIESEAIKRVNENRKWAEYNVEEDRIAYIKGRDYSRPFTPRIAPVKTTYEKLKFDHEKYNIPSKRKQYYHW